MILLTCAAAFLGALSWTGTPRALAVKQFKDQFEAKYVKKDSRNPKDKQFAALVAKAKCNICHEGTSKKNRNVYGRELAKLLDRRKDKNNVKKIRQALDTVAKLRSNPKDKRSPTFGELIARGQLPAGNPK